MPPPLPLPPIPDQPPERPAPRRWPGYLLLSLVVVLLSAGLTYGLRLIDGLRATNAYSDGWDGAKALLAGQQDAWNRGDLAGFMAGYWKDDRLTFSSGGTVTRGWQATFDRYQKRYQAEGKEMGTLTFSELEVEPLAADAAFVRGRWGLVFAKSEDRPSGLFTVVLRKTADGWKVVHDHTSVAEPAKKN